MKRLEVKKLDFSYGRNQILFEFDFSLEESQIGCLLGPSGGGKTTALRAIAGFEKPTKGEIILNGNKLNSSKIFVEPEKRQIGMVFQDIALFPHLSVKENIQFGIRSLSQNLRDKRSNELLDLVGMSEFKKKYPAESDPIEPAGFGAGLHLHARLLSLPHPGDGGARRARLVVVAPLPPHMTRTWHHLGFDPGTDGDPFAELYT